MKKLLYLFVALLAFASCQHQEDVACKVQVNAEGNNTKLQSVYMGKKSDKADTFLGSYEAKYYVPYGYYVQANWTVYALSSNSAKYKTNYSLKYTFCVNQATELDVKVGYRYDESGNIYHYCTIGGKEEKVYSY